MSVQRSGAALVGKNFGLAIIAYVLTLQFIYPRFLAPFAALHADMYIAPDLAVSGYTPFDVMTWPRPITWLTLLIEGRWGSQGAAITCTGITLLALALAVTIVERSIARFTLPWWLLVSTFLYAMSAPSFYFDAGYDVASSLALLFGFGAIYFCESERKDVTTLLGTGMLFMLSMLAKESFVTIIFAYSWVRAIRSRNGTMRLGFAILPIVVLGLSLADSRVATSPYAHATFVHFGAASGDPYFIDVGLQSLAGALAYYLPPLLSPLNIVLISACLVLAYLNGRLWTALMLLAASLSLYLPYLVLPNHRLGYYYWAPIPVAMLLIPIAFSVARTKATGIISSRVPRHYANTALVTVVLATAWSFGAADVALGSWSLQQQDINRNLMGDLHKDRAALRTAKTVLVCGVTFPFHPWAHAGALAIDLGFAGRWNVATEPNASPVLEQRTARAVHYGDVDFNDYDLTLVIDPNGHLAGTYNRQAMMAEKRAVAPNATPERVIAALHDPAFLSEHAAMLQRSP